MKTQEELWILVRLSLAKRIMAAQAKQANIEAALDTAYLMGKESQILTAPKAAKTAPKKK